jgi:hypothetical protein
MIPSQWEERASRYKSRKFENLNQQAIEDHIVCGLIAWGEQGIGSYHKLMLEKGEWFIGRAKVEGYPTCKAFKKRFRPKMKECFYNAQMFTVTMNEGKYYEGFMCDGFITVMHGWVVMPDGKVVDFTLEDRDKHLERTNGSKEGISLNNIAYLGLEVPTDFIRGKIIETRSCIVLAHMYYLNDHRQFIID